MGHFLVGFFFNLGINNIFYLDAFTLLLTTFSMSDYLLLCYVLRICVIVVATITFPAHGRRLGWDTLAQFGALFCCSFFHHFPEFGTLFWQVEHNFLYIII